MNLNSISDTQLFASFENLVRSERKITAQVLECIAEIDRRRLYLEKNFTSLFDYLVKNLGYSPGAAMRRIDGARLLRELPEVIEKVQNGSITLSQANQLERASRELKKNKNEVLSTKDKRALLLQIENTTQKQTEQILATSLDLPITPVQKETLHKDQSVTLTITFTSEQMKILEQAQNMISHAVPNKNWANVVTHLAKREVSRRTNTRQSFSQKVNQNQPSDGEPTVLQPPTAVAAVKPQMRKSLISNSKKILHTTTQKRPAIPAAIRKELIQPTATCSHKDYQGKQCENKKFLQIDHIYSWSRGGGHEPQNLQVLCAAHNRLKYAREAKIQFD